MEAIKVKIYKASPLMYAMLGEIAQARGEDAPFVLSQVKEGIGLQAIDPETTDVLMVVLGESASADWKFIKDVKAAYPQVPVLVLARCSSKVTLHMALKSGVEGLVTEEQSLHWFLSVLQKLAAGEKYFDADAMIELAGEDISVLDHERRLLVLIAQEKDRNAIAKHLKIGVRTVDMHLNALRKKLGVLSNVGLALYAKRVGLV